MGKVQDGILSCGYHGLCFDKRGNCVDQRFNDHIRTASKIRHFPTCERHGVIWIWMGESSVADTALIPDFSFLDDSSRIVFKGTTYVNANYQLEVDNLLDLSHLDYVHLGTISNGAVTKGEYQMEQNGSTVHSNWWVPETKCPTQFSPFVADPAEPVDHWLDMRWDAPAILYLDVGVAPVGTDRLGKYDVLQGHFVTPETQITSHYLWIASRPGTDEPPEMNDMFRELARKAFEDEDLPFVEAGQRGMKSTNFWDEKPVIFPEDAGAVRARRVLDKLIRDEARALNE
jgi:vanillate O-demethylase monooxygenase subunit